METQRSEHRGYGWLSARVAGLACAGAVSIAGLFGCATNPVPDEKIAVAKAAVAHAEQAGAPELAPVEMAAARDKLAHAEHAAADRHDDEAAAWADQANLEAQVAEAAAVQHRSHEAAVQLDASLQALRQEEVRNSQSNQ